MKSPTTQEINSKRLSFFDAPTEPVRINAWSFLGLKKETPKPDVIEENVAAVKAEEEVKVLISKLEKGVFYFIGFMIALR